MRLPRLAIATAALVLVATSAHSRPIGHEAQTVIDTMLAPPSIKAESGFSAKMLVAPGELYDPLFMLPRGQAVWMNDDGRATNGHGSRILSLTPEGKISVLIGADKLLPVTGFDIAPQGFGNFGGQLFAIAQPTTAMKGATANHVIERIDLAAHSASVVCTLPTAGTAGKGVAGFGVEARFGPAGSGFANTFYSIAALNDMIYKTTADGSCAPFADFAQFGAPAGLTFAHDGSAMLVTVTPGDLIAGPREPKGLILRVGPDGKIDSKPVATGLLAPFGIDIAPSSFGSYGDQIFVNDLGDIQIPAPQTQQLKRDGKVYRVTKEGELKLVASGFVNPSGLRFIGNHLWVTDINGDFIAGMRELPDGFLTQIDTQ